MLAEKSGIIINIDSGVDSGNDSDSDKSNDEQKQILSDNNRLSRSNQQDQIYHHNTWIED